MSCSSPFVRKLYFGGHSVKLAFYMLYEQLIGLVVIVKLGVDVVDLHLGRLEEVVDSVEEVWRRLEDHEAGRRVRELSMQAVEASF